ncbi:MAG: segregation/condensation protein A [Anaerolineales bacterium]|nr:segregation/condensation protein A [Anaerolineales bacterium]
MKKYKIDLPAFAGPLDLLLHLIEREELDITAVSLVQITGQYLAQVEQLKEDRLDELIDFLVIGARLALIKSRALLPQTPGLPGDGEEEEDPAEALVRQLRQYKRFKEAASWLHEREEQNLRTYLRVAPPPKLEERLDMTGISVESLITAVLDVLSHAENLEESVAIAQPRQLTIEGQIKRLRARLKHGESFMFQDLLSSERSRVEISVTLLAVLELIKRHEATAVQTAMFGPIEIRAYEEMAPAENPDATTTAAPDHNE